MPIYAYRCADCGHAKDVLQKMSDPVLSVCPACGQASLVKQVTAAGFQLKGSGWYATDFKGSGSGAPASKDGAPAAKDGDAGATAPAAAPAPAANAESSKPAGAASSASGPASPASTTGPSASH